MAKSPNTDRTEGSGSRFAIIASVVSSIGAALVTGIFTYMATKKADALIHLQVIPLEMSGTSFPPPIVKINNERRGEPYNFNISGEASVSVDVNDALLSFQKANKSLQVAKQTINEISIKIEDVNKLTDRLTQLNQLTVGDVCPGGAHGIPLPHAEDITKVLGELNAQVSNIKNNIVKQPQ